MFRELMNCANLVRHQCSAKEDGEAAGPRDGPML